MIGPTHWRIIVGLISCASVVVGGCASVSDHAQNSSLTALATNEPAAGKGLRTLQGRRSCQQQEFQSPAPSVLPRPGHMPAGTFMHEIQEKGRLVVGVDQNSLGLGYYNP
ncbi:MAG TPA: hypothetical protein VF526_09005, partial [Solirubrobacteraceae bacterium]